MLSFISPCVLPLVPAYIGYMGGRLTHNISREATGAMAGASLALRLQMLFHGIAFVLGFTLVFVLVGLFTTALPSLAGRHVSAFTEILGRVGGMVIIFFGFQFMGLSPRSSPGFAGKGKSGFWITPGSASDSPFSRAPLLYWAFLEQIAVALPLILALLVALFVKGAFSEPARFWHGLLDRLESMLYAIRRADIAGGGRSGLLGSAFMGMVFSAGWTPCIGPLLGTILTLAAASGATSGDIAYGMVLLTAYSIGWASLHRNRPAHEQRPEPAAPPAAPYAQGRAIERFALGRHRHPGRQWAAAKPEPNIFARRICRFQLPRGRMRRRLLEGKLGFSHLGACLRGSLVPVAINQSASGFFSPEMPLQQYLFHGGARRSIDVEIRSVNENAPDFELALYDPRERVLARASRSASLEADGRLYPLLGFRLESAGLYRLEMRNTSEIETWRFRVKVGDAAPIETAPVGSPIIDDSEAGEAMTSFTDIAADLAPALGLAMGNRAPGFTIATLDGSCHFALRPGRERRPAEFLGHLVRSLPARDARIRESVCGMARKRFRNRRHRVQRHRSGDGGIPR